MKATRMNENGRPQVDDNRPTRCRNEGYQAIAIGASGNLIRSAQHPTGTICNSLFSFGLVARVILLTHPIHPSTTRVCVFVFHCPHLDSRNEGL